MSENKPSGTMSPISLRVRCFAEEKEGQWQAFSLELGLAAQGDSFHDVKKKLNAMVVDYVVEAVTIDREHVATLLGRRATWSVFVKYYAVFCLKSFGAIDSKWCVVAKQ